MLDHKMDTFIKVVELLSFTKAADVLGLTQPAVSQHISRLEEYYGCKLISMNGRRISLTTEGETLYHYACQQKANEKHLIEILNQSRRHIKLGSTLSIADYYLPDLLLANKKDPQHILSVTVGNTDNLLKQIVDGELDCALIEGLFDSHKFEYRFLIEEEFIPVVSAAHPLAGKKVKLSDLFSYPLITREHGSGTRAIMENYLYQQNCSVDNFESLWELGSFALIKRMLTEIPGVSFMYKQVASEQIKKGELTVLDIHQYHISHPFYFVYSKDNINHDALEAFYNELTMH
jgi:DNA-binding transcriptional LysR family regulator